MNKNIKYILTATIIIITLCAPACPTSAREVIKTYDVEVQIHKDRSMTVTENITAAVENIEINRGIIRVFPVDYIDNKLGQRVRVGFEVLDVKIDGRTTKKSVTKAGRYREVQIGDPNITLSRGDHTFTITYKTNSSAFSRTTTSCTGM